MASDSGGGFEKDFFIDMPVVMASRAGSDSGGGFEKDFFFLKEFFFRYAWGHSV